MDSVINRLVFVFAGFNSKAWILLKCRDVAIGSVGASLRFGFLNESR